MGTVPFPVFQNSRAIGRTSPLVGVDEGRVVTHPHMHAQHDLNTLTTRRCTRTILADNMGKIYLLNTCVYLDFTLVFTNTSHLQ